MTVFSHATLFSPPVTYTVVYVTEDNAMLIGYARVSKADGSQTLDLQRDALRAAGVRPEQMYEDFASGMKDDRPGLLACLKALREGDVLVVWKLDRLGRNLRHLLRRMRASVSSIGNQGLEGPVVDGQQRMCHGVVLHKAGVDRQTGASASDFWRSARTSLQL